MYVAVKGGEQAIANAHALLAEKRRGDTGIAELTVVQIRQQLPLAVDRVMTEGSLYDPELAALAIKQASGDVTEAIFLLRAYRTTLPRWGSTEPIDTSAMTIERRISATFKDIPGGQVLGPTYDYTHRLLDFRLLADGESDVSATCQPDQQPVSVSPVSTSSHYPPILDLLNRQGLIEAPATEQSQSPADITTDPVTFPADRAQRMQALVRGDEGFLLALAYSTQRGYGRNHAFAGEIRSGDVRIFIVPEELGFAIDIGDISVTECEMVNQFIGSKTTPPTFTRGYGLAFGFAERKAMAMAMVDRSLRVNELGERVESPAQDEEFVLAHCDNVEAVGFVSHLKLPHYVDFQSELELVRKLRGQSQTRTADSTTDQSAEHSNATNQPPSTQASKQRPAGDAV